VAGPAIGSVRQRETWSRRGRRSAKGGTNGPVLPDAIQYAGEIIDFVRTHLAQR
jgi:hypothetical protein